MITLTLILIIDTLFIIIAITIALPLRRRHCITGHLFSHYFLIQTLFTQITLNTLYYDYYIVIDIEILLAIFIIDSY